MGVNDLLGAPGVPAALAPFWHDLILVDDAPGSQYEALREAMAAGGRLPGHVACVALTGRGFHGQHSRQWSVCRGNLHLSAVLACDLPAAAWAPIMPALPAVALAEAIRTLGRRRLEPGIKWVNDVLLSGRKVAGSLTALRTFRGRITSVVVGLGLNVAVVPPLPGEMRALAATSLQAELAASEPALEEVLVAVLSALASRFDRLVTAGPADLLAAYRRLSLVVGQTVEIWPDEGGDRQVAVVGEVVSIEPDLSLRLRGRPEHVAAGRLTLRREPDGGGNVG